MIHFMLCFSRQGRVRLERWYPTSSMEPSTAYNGDIQFPVEGREGVKRAMVRLVLGRKRGQCSFVEWSGFRIVYKRYASLVFCCAIDRNDNELIALEHIHRYVELLDRYFSNVCELDLIYNFDRAISIWDELFLGGEMQESSVIDVLESMRRMNLNVAQCNGKQI